MTSQEKRIARVDQKTKGVYSRPSPHAIEEKLKSQMLWKNKEGDREAYTHSKLLKIFGLL